MIIKSQQLWKIDMQKFRNSVSQVAILEKVVQYCGKTIKKSKKKVKWIISHKNMEHTIMCVISFMSGKKKVQHNGLTIVDTVKYLLQFILSSEQNLNAVIMIGKNRVKIRVEKDTEDLKFQESNYQTLQNAFFKWKNVWSQQPIDIYSKVFNNF